MKNSINKFPPVQAKINIMKKDINPIISCGKIRESKDPEYNCMSMDLSRDSQLNALIKMLELLKEKQIKYIRFQQKSKGNIMAELTMRYPPKKRTTQDQQKHGGSQIRRSKFKPSSRISYLGVFLFNCGLADSENSKESINIDRMIKSNEFASYYEKESGEGCARIYECKGRDPDREKKLGEVRVFHVMDDYFLCKLLVNVDGPLEYCITWLLVRSYEKTCYNEGKWEKMNIMEKIAGLNDPFDVEEIIKQHKQYCILPTYSDPHPTPPGGK
jgi:hypothetical protein